MHQFQRRQRGDSYKWDNIRMMNFQRLMGYASSLRLQRKRKESKMGRKTRQNARKTK